VGARSRTEVAKPDASTRWTPAARDVRRWCRRRAKGTVKWEVGSGGRSTAEDLLAQRFARGEIEEADYRQRLRIPAEPADAPSHSP
jgi:hypothetical protein